MDVVQDESSRSCYQRGVDTETHTHRTMPGLGRIQAGLSLTSDLLLFGELGSKYRESLEVYSVLHENYLGTEAEKNCYLKYTKDF